VSRIALQTWGSEGDVRPFLVLARALAEHGHEVRLAIADPSGREYAAPPGVRLERVAREASLSADSLDRLHRDFVAATNPVRQGSRVIECMFTPYLAPMLSSARALAGWADITVRHYFLHPAAAAAEQAGILDIALQPSPDQLPTRAWPPAGMPALSPVVNALGWSLAARMTRRMLLGQVNATRAELGLSPVGDVLQRVWTGRNATLVTASPALCPVPDDWRAGIHVTGWLRSSVVPGALPAAVEAFLAAGPAPVLATLGSLNPRGEAERARLLTTFGAAASRAGCRLIVQVAGAVEARWPHVCVTGPIPHDSLLPRCSAAVHHGGAGTTHSAAAAGIPAVVVPHAFDQFFWAQRLCRLGIAPPPLPRRRLNARRLAGRLRAVQVSEAVRARATAIGRRLQHEDGAAKAVAVIERTLEQP